MPIFFPLLSIVIFFTFGANAQEYNRYARSFGFGIKGGTSLTNLSAGSNGNALTSGYSSIFGPDAALFVEFKLSNLISIEPVLEYSSQGGQKNGIQAFPTPAQVAAVYPGTPPKYLYANFKNKVQLNYLMFPLLLKLNHDFEDSPFGAYVSGGPFGAYLLSGKQVSSGSSTVYLDKQGQQPLPVGSQSFNQNNDLKGQLQPYNYGIEGNVGFVVKLDGIDQNFLFIEAGGNYGLFNIQKNSSNGSNNTGAVTFSLGYSCWF